MTRNRRVLALAVTLICITIASATVAITRPSPRAQAAAVAGNLFFPIEPVRVLDTRTDTYFAEAPLPTNTEGRAYYCVIPYAGWSQLPATGKVSGTGDVCVWLTGLPAGVTAVLLNVTAVDSDGPGYVQVVKDNGLIGITSNLNKAQGATVANEVTARVSPGANTGAGPSYVIVVHNVGSATHLLVDLEGYYQPAVL